MSIKLIPMMIYWPQLVLLTLDVVLVFTHKFLVSFKIYRAVCGNKDVISLPLMIRCMLDMYAPVASVREIVVMYIINSY